MVDPNENDRAPASRTASVATPETGGAPDPFAGTRYRVLRKIAAGQMGEVVEAEDLVLRRRVAVKIIRREYAAVPGFADRLRLEAQAVAVVAERSPHVVSALDLGRTADGRAYIVFERLIGRTLGDELRARKFLPPEEAVALMRQLLSGLAAAHEAGIVHRDIKNENIFLCDALRGGQRVLKILDFGIAKVVDPAAAGAPTPLALPTAQGMVFGTPRYLAPEQVLGQPKVDHRADIYAAGMLLYTLLAGRDPFHRYREVFDILTAQVTETPEPPSALAEQSIPKALDDAVMRALQKRPEDRFPDAASFAAALGAALTAGPTYGDRRRWPQTERVDLSAFQAPSPAATMAGAPAVPSPADDRTVATMPLAVTAASPCFQPARGGLPRNDERAEPSRESQRPTVPLPARRPARLFYAGIALLVVVVLLQLAVVWRLHHG